MHVQQVEIFIVARSKAAAAELLRATQRVTPTSLTVQLATGNDANALVTAGVPGPAIYVYAGLGHGAPDRRVLRVDLDGSTHQIGHFEGHTFDATVLVTGGGA
jgi:hypothetical protein